MKRWLAAMSAVGVVVASSTAIEAQEREWDRVGERVAEAVERALRQAERATERAFAALEDMDFDVHWDGESWFDDESAGPLVQEEFRWTGDLAGGDLLEIKGVNGPISAMPASGNRVEIVALKSGRRSDPAEVRIEVIEHSGGVTLCAVYPTPRGERANECGVGDEGRNSVQRNDVRVSWEVRVPGNVHFRGATVNGDVEAIDLGSDVELVTVNGDVEIETAGFANARTVNGSIRARMDGAANEASFETVNGSIELDVDDGLNADLDASWLNGDLESDLPFRVRGRMGRRSAQGALGDGGPTLRLRTVNGSIRIH